MHPQPHFGDAGTSACTAGRFYCSNKGYEPQFLNASMVDDGFCGETPDPCMLKACVGRPLKPGASLPVPDCCDGSDEGPGLCKNTCAEAGAAALAALRERAAAEAAGAAVRAGYLQQAAESLRSWAEQDAQLTADISQAKRATETWRGAHCCCPKRLPTALRSQTIDSVSDSSISKS